MTEVDRSGIVLPRRALRQKLDVAIEGRVVLRHSPTAATPRSGPLAWPAPLLPFLRGTGRVTVTGVDGTTYVDQDVAFDPSPGRTSIADQRGPLAVDKFGRLQRVFSERDPAGTALVLDQTERVLTTLSGAGVPAFLAGGTLLGAVRDGELIGHDSDVDLGYLSAASTVHGVTLESYRLERVFKAEGIATTRFSGGEFKVLLPGSGAPMGIDVRAAFVRGAGLYVPPDVVVPLAALTDASRPGLPLASASLHGRPMPVPADAAAFLLAGYGPGWSVPDPHYVYAVEPALDRRLDGWVRGAMTERTLWQGWHQAHAARRREKPSPFASWVLGRVDPAMPFVDLGCGDGRDAVGLAAGGRRVIGLDYSTTAVAQARRAGRRAGADSLEVHAATLGDLRQALHWGARLAHEHPRWGLYARDLVEVLDRQTRANLWVLASMALRRGGRLFLTAGADPSQLPRATARRLARRPVDADQLVTELEAHGGSVVHREDKPGGHAGAPARTRLVATWQR